MKSPFPRALVLATVIHAVCLGFFVFFAPAPHPAPSSSLGHREFFDLSLEDVIPPGVDEPLRDSGQIARAHVAPARKVSSSPGAGGSLATSPGLGIVLDPSGSDADGMPGSNGPKAGGRENGTGDGRTRGIDLGIDRGMTWLWTEPDRPPPKPRPASTSGGLREALDAHDRKVGMGFGGPVVSAFHAVAASPSAPQRGRARFEAVVDGSGRAVAVHVLSADGDMESWRRVAQQVLAALRGKVLRVPADGQGVAILLEVRSRYQLPSGAVPGEAVKLRGAGAEFDLSDIGAVPSHNVAVRVLTERRL